MARYKRGEEGKCTKVVNKKSNKRDNKISIILEEADARGRSEVPPNIGYITSNIAPLPVGSIQAIRVGVLWTMQNMVYEIWIC